ncbi:hypothetical protein KM176_20445 [Pseudooceanicola sp. CBS1P-1]|uniref:Auto-transporter adhesin head GIN domain-containing protein n=1 Tax=Pseudooceanicola albus TaxID=2692189 RepID=A0A6L7G9G9_9RHOB|nr:MULTISPECIES: hypothetical protein [Pseudooceanicola]MBT9386252.1 hypothetical protein [Pseudooceanicola endophyticus]MXN20302.1 hypothetical protein [Pseudooceanicola albus]
MRFHIRLSPRPLLALALTLASLQPALAGTTRQTTTLPDTIRKVRLAGDGTALALSTGSGRALDVSAEDSFGCQLTASLRQEGDTLEITVSKGGLRLGFWCDPDVTVVMPENMDLDIALQDLAADLGGDFSDVSITSANSVVNFDGSAAHFSLSGKRAAVKLNFAPDMARDAVKLDVKSLLSQVSFKGA